MALEQKQAEKQGPSSEVRYWTNEIAAARKREKNYRKEGERVRAIYAGEKKNTTPFNILYSNTETQLPALYSSTPKPVVQRRFRDDDPVARAAAMAGQRTLEFLIDTNVDEYEPFDHTMRDAVLDALLPGRGIARAKYEAEITPVPVEDKGPDGQSVPRMDAEGNPVTEDRKTWEMVCTESVAWNRVYFGFYKRWPKCPWIAFEWYLDKDEATAKFTKAVADKMIFSVTDEDEKADGEKSKKGDVDEGSEKRTCLVYEIWKRKGKKVCFVAPNYHAGYLKEEDDPLDLTGFYPMPRPLQFLLKTDDPMPTALYALYENQAAELNRISTRINRIVEAIKVRGAYDGSLGDTLKDLLDSDDNTLTPTSNASSIALEGGIDKYIWFMPLDKLVMVLRELIVARQECKQIIYEVTGLSDIIRGATDAGETATAQQIKNQWGSLRIKMTQNEVRRYVRDMLRIMLEIAAKKFSPDTFAKMTGLPFVTAMQKQQAKALLQAAQAQQPPAMPGQPPQPQDPAIAQAQQIAQTPSWEEIQALLQDDMDRAYRIDIETNSTVEVNEQEDKQAITEAMTALGQFLEGVTPLVQSGAMPFPAAKSILLAIVRRFRFGTEVEEEIKSMQAPKAGGPSPEQQDAEQKVMQATAANEQLTTDLTKEKAMREADKREADLKAREEKLRHDEELFALKKRQCADMDAVRVEREGEKDAARKKELADMGKQTDDRVRQVQGLALKTEAPSQAAKSMEALFAKFVEVLQEDRAAGRERDEALLKAILADVVPDRDEKSNRVTRLRRVPAAA